jgi:hypothetical protein
MEHEEVSTDGPRPEFSSQARYKECFGARATGTVIYFLAFLIGWSTLGWFLAGKQYGLHYIVLEGVIASAMVAGAIALYLSKWRDCRVWITPDRIVMQTSWFAFRALGVTGKRTLHPIRAFRLAGSWEVLIEGRDLWGSATLIARAPSVDSIDLIISCCNPRG